MCIWRLRPSHKPQGGHADADGDGKDGTQGQETVVEGGTGGEDVVHKENMAISIFLCACFVCFECAFHVGGLLLGGDLGLGAGASAAAENIGAHEDPQFACDLLCDDFSLVIAPFPAAAPVQGNRDHCIHILEALRTLEPDAQHPSEMAAEA